MGAAVGTVTDADAARQLAQKATDLAALAPELPDFVSLPAHQPLPAGPPAVAGDVLACTPASRAEAVAAALAIAQEHDLQAAGALEVEYASFAIVNSLGVAAAHSSTRASFHVVMQTEDSSGYGAAEGVRLADTRVRETAGRAAEKALLARHPRPLAPGPMTVLLEPVAAAEPLFALALGFNALRFREQRSFVCDWLGKQACAPCFSLVDDGADPRTYPLPFDFEGVPKRRVELIRAGVVHELVYDTYTALSADPPRESTGHGLPPPNTYGPVPLNLVVSPGAATEQELIRQVERGILVSRIHYLNVVHERRLILTGMTRDGTLVIEKGEIVGGCHNLRFTENFVQALGRLQAVGAEGELHGHVWTPCLLLDGFSFTSATDF
jgi:predicted Zn-dependent protease